MIISIRDSSEIPIFQQIHNQIIQGISDGRLKPGEQLPTVRALADEIGINAMTVSKAYQLLKQEGYILADRRNGARVRDDFSQVRGLSPLSRELLQQIISEAKVSGMSRSEFLSLCSELYPENGENPAERSKLCSILS
ncbi:MAG: GntR family transcriptional regulator [Acetatifactor sp.]|nr:GntR family transcriptional regulator [Acetatifactor sp.]